MDDNNFREKERIFLGLIATASQTNADINYHTMPIKEHPFGLGLMDEQSTDFERLTRKHANCFVGFLTTTDSNVENMKKEIVKRLAIKCPDGKKIRLRTVAVEISAHHHCQTFYEIAFPAEGTLICSGYVKGSDKQNKETMDNLFKFLASLYGVEIEKVEIPYKTARIIISKLDKEITAYHINI